MENKVESKKEIYTWIIEAIRRNNYLGAISALEDLIEEEEIFYEKARN